MSINWYPGHMHKARKEIIKVLNAIDIIIEVVDARLPFSSQNPIIKEFRQQKPTIILLNKCDLADDERTEQWQHHYSLSDNIKTLRCEQQKPEKTRQIISLCQQLAPEKASSFKAINAMIMGIPNVGKSTIINTLANKVIAKVGNEPAVTKNQQKINLPHNIILHDTPGILWPKIENPNSGYRLAISGAIKNTAMEYDDVGYYAAEYFLEYYPQLLQQRYQLENLPEEPMTLLEMIGKRRGAVQSKSRVNIHKVCELLLHEFRDASLGKITLETPQMIGIENQEIEKIKTERQNKKKNNSKKNKLQ